MSTADDSHPLWPDDPAQKTLLVLFLLASALYWISLYLYVPTLPTYVRSRTESLSLVGVVLAQYGLWQTIVRVPIGIGADWWGRRKPFILAGFLLSAIGALVLGSAVSVEGLILGRAITGLAAATWVPLVAAFSTLFPPEKAIQATAALSFAGTGGRLLATSVTGSLNTLGGYSLAFFLAAGAAGLAALALGPTRPANSPSKRPSARGIGTLATRADVLLPSLLAAALQYVTWASSFGFIPVLAEELGATDVTQSILVSLYIGVSLAGNLGTTTLLNHVGVRSLTSASFLLTAVGVGAAALATSLRLIHLAQVCIGLSHGIAYPLLMGLTIRDVADGDRTVAMGVHQAIYAAGMFAGPALSGYLAGVVGIQPMFGLTALACLLPVILGHRWLSGRPTRVH